MSFLYPLLGLVAGIMFAGFHPTPWLGGIPVIAGLAIYYALLRKSSVVSSAFRHNRLHNVWIFMLFTGVGIFNAGFRQPGLLPEDLDSANLVAVGTVNECLAKATGDVLGVDVEEVTDSTGKTYQTTNLKVLLRTDGFAAIQGDRLNFKGVFRILEENPNLYTDTYTRRLQTKGFRYAADVIDDNIILLERGEGILASSHVLRERLAVMIEKSGLSHQTAGFLTALLLGDRSLLDPNVKTSFSNTGVAHALALSGMHVGIIMGIILFLLFPLKIAGLHKARYWLAVLLIWGFAYLTGFGVPTVRACLMTTLSVIAMSLQRRKSVENALLASAFIILMVDPISLYDVGMQLSFLCVASIIVFAGPLNPIRQRPHPWLHSLVAAVLVTLSSTLATWVLVSFYFGTVPFMFLPANLLLLPLLPCYVCIAILYLSLFAVGIDWHALAWCLDTGYSFFTSAAEWLSDFGGASISLRVNAIVTIVWLVGILVAAKAIRADGRRRSVLLAAAGSMGCLAVAFAIFMKQSPSGFIVRDTRQAISLALYDGDMESVVEMPGNSVSRIIHKGTEFFAIDCPLDGVSLPDSLAGMLLAKKTNSRRILILGGGFKNTGLKDIPGIKGYDKIILHPSLKRKMEQILKQEAVESGINAIHSLRDEGPFREFPTDTLRASK